ncbi:storkhead-box protein 1 [Dromiciops gliroides]|uniref:storkhead-box protein 1 n=1 Tax=Dromiciops gliroides TaxID=33562 RepID=UPI001CC440D2|nr:storkhead-box protein 1 [Dromiciops gliroides]
MARPVQLAPGSLALVLCRQERERGAAGAPAEAPELEPGVGEASLDELLPAGIPGSLEAEDGEPGGRALFRAFRRANARCFWNARLARAASRLAFQGWLRRGVLLVHGPPGSLQVLRDAWLRRALRPPRGFRIRAVGDVFPVQMNPITQSQFIPLAEVLCCAIADMNASHVVVTQESLMDQLLKHYPGIATPSQDILYTTLGNLIKERKIYHTGEGYFIVTPQTYFITSTATQEKKRVPLEDSHPLPTSVTYLVSMDSQAELTKENATSPSHCKSCRCFPDPCPQEGRGSPPTGDGNRKGQKNSGEAKPLVQSQAISTSVENPHCNRTKPLPLAKDKEKSKKFGLRLFWRQMSRKERPRKDHRTFSAQFPPEEWPVRDEENLDNIPRDVEHEIIKRINPELTVDNLIRHTVLMQKYEERKKYMNQGTSTDLQAAGHKQQQQQQQPGKAGVRRRESRSGRHRRKGHSSRDRPRGWSQRSSQGSEPKAVITRAEKHSKHLPAEAAPRAKTPEEGLALKPPGATQSSGDANPHVIYKKRINNPFPGFPHRGNLKVRGFKGQKSSELKPKPTEKPKKSFQRSKSLDSSRNSGNEGQQQCSEQPKDIVKPGIPFSPNNASVQPVGDCLPDYSPGRFLRTSGKGHPFRESQLGQKAYGGQDKTVPDVQWKIHACADPPGETQTEMQCRSAPQASLIDQAVVHQFQNLGLLDHRLSSAQRVRQPERQSRDTPKELTGRCWETLRRENEGFTDDDDDHKDLYQKEVDGDEDVCSSLYLEEEEEEEDFAEKHILCPTQPGHIPYSFTDRSPWDSLGETKVTEGALDRWKLRSDLTDYSSKIQRLELQTFERNDCHRPTGPLTNTDGHQKRNFSGENCGPHPCGYHCDEEVGSATRVQASSELVDCSIFDYYNTSEADSEAETLQNSAGEVGEKSAGWGLGAQGEEMRTHFRQKPELFGDSRMPGLAQRAQPEQNHLEGTENHSLTGDSGIDSPRAQSLASNNSAILEGLKRRQSFLQNLEGINSMRNGQMLTSNSLLQLTPVINV